MLNLGSKQRYTCHLSHHMGFDFCIGTYFRHRCYLLPYIIPQKNVVVWREFWRILHPNGSRPLLIPSIDAMLLSCGENSSIAVFRLWMGIAMILFCTTWMYKVRTVFDVGQHVRSSRVWSLWLQFNGRFWGLVELSHDDPKVQSHYRRTSRRYHNLHKIYDVGTFYWQYGVLLSLCVLSIGLFFGDTEYKSLVPVVMIVMLWPLKNIAEGLHPLFPYAGWVGDSNA